MTIKYRKAGADDIEDICCIVRDAIDVMEQNRIYQWDNLYPAKEDFEEDIRKGQLYVGEVNGRAAVMYTLNQKCDKEYENGNWKYQDEPFYVVHRLCVDPAFQNKGIAKAALLNIEQQLTKMRIHVIRLDVFSGNPFALRLYESFAYWRKGRFYLMEKRF